MAAVTDPKHLEIGKTYRFTPPEGEFPKCHGLCTLMRINGNMLGLEQVKDEKNKFQTEYDAMGRAKKTVPFVHPEYTTAQLAPREIGRQGWVHYQSFATIE